MTALLPPNLLRLFAPRPPLPYLRPMTKDDRERGPDKLRGIGDIVRRLRDEEEERELKAGLEDAPTQEANGMDVDVKQENGEDGEVKDADGDEKMEAKDKKKSKKDPISAKGIIGQEAVKLRREARKRRKEEYKKNAEASWDPNHDAHATGDPYKTLFISRLSSKATEADLRQEFEVYGHIAAIHIVRDRRGKSRNYAFIVYERERDMKAAYKDADGIPIHHKNILVDVERGRTVKGWKPRRLGGGLGGRPKPVVEAPPPPFAAGGGFRGGRGGFGGRGGGGGFRGGRGGFGGGGGGFGGGGGGGFGGGGGGGFRGGGGGYRGGPGGGFGGGGRGPPGGFGGPGTGANSFGGPPGGGGGYGYGSSLGTADNSGGGYGNGPAGGPPPPGGGYKRDFDAPPGGGGGFGYDDRDSKRPRY